MEIHGKVNMLLLRKLTNAMLRINRVRSVLSVFMTFWVLKVQRRKIRIYSGDLGYIGEHTIQSNMRIVHEKSDLPEYAEAKFIAGIGTNQGGVKADMLLEPVNAVLAARLRDRKSCEILSIGPRSFGELLNIRSHGYAPENITGVDLFSMFSKIRLGDMHRLPFPDNQFDVVLCGWVLAYSKNRSIAAAEIIRVLKPGGLVSIGVSYTTETNDEQRRKRGYLIGTEDRIVSCEQIRQYFGDDIKEIFFSVEPDPEQNHSQILFTAAVK